MFYETQLFMGSIWPTLASSSSHMPSCNSVCSGYYVAIRCQNCVSTFDTRCVAVLQGMTKEMPCPQASYCPEGTVVPKLCPAGTAAKNTDLHSASQCTLCPEGKYCGDAGLEVPSGDCQAGFYCGEGSASSAPQVSAHLAWRASIAQVERKIALSDSQRSVWRLNKLNC